MKVITMLKTGNFNTKVTERINANSVLITLSKRNDKHIYKLWVKDLYQPTELVLKEEITEV